LLTHLQALTLTIHAPHAPWAQREKAAQKANTTAEEEAEDAELEARLQAIRSA